MRTTTSAAGLLLLAGFLAGCGGDSAPTDATEAQFCDTYGSLVERMAEMNPEDPSTGIRAMKDWADAMQETGTPEDMPDDAREGFERMVESIRGIDEDATLQELEQLGEDISETGEAFGTYATETCPDALGGLLGDLEDEMGELEDLTESPTS